MDTMTVDQPVRIAANTRYKGIVVETTPPDHVAGYVDVEDSLGIDEPQKRVHFHASELIEDLPPPEL